MTEAEWLAATDHRQLIAAVERQRMASERKRTLLACACVYRIWLLFHHKQSRLVAELREQIADGSLAPVLKESASLDATNEPLYNPDEPPNVPEYMLWRGNIAWAIQEAARSVADFSNTLPDSPTWNTAFESECAVQWRFAHDIFGNPFRPITLNPACLTSTVVTLTTGIYEEKAFDRMPILADALQDAGCDNEDILNHCRQSGEHCRGCWCVDLILSKC
jgi:hypothetical protein